MKVAKWGQYARWLRRSRTGGWMALLAIALCVAYRPVMAGEPKAKKTSAPLATLLAEVVSARPPYEPARFDLGRRGAGDPKQGPAAMIERARDRQERLEEMWQQLNSEPLPKADPEQRAARTLLGYAFGELDLDAAAAAAKAAGPAAEFRLARLLLAECRFDRAVTLLAALADRHAKLSADDISRAALTLLVRHDAQRAALAAHVPLVPLEFDLRGYLDRRSQDPAVKSWIETVRRTTFCRLPAELRSADSEPCSIETVDLPSPGDVDESLLRLGLNEGLLEPSLEMPSSARAWELLKLHDLKRLYLATGGPELVLYQTRQDAVDANHTALTLHADFNGPIRFRLYRLATLAAWQELGAAGLTRLKPQRTWSQTFQPLECNNSDPEDWPVPLDNLGEGYYLLTAEARYAPMLAACKFCVNHLAVYLRAGRDRAVIVAVDRRDGRPVADLPLRLHISGKPDENRLCQRCKPAVKEEFLRGFRGEKAAVHYDSGPEAADQPSPAKDSSHPDADPAGEAKCGEEELCNPSLSAVRRAAESYVQGIEARRRNPDFQQVRPLRTAADGAATVAVDLGQGAYRYQLDVERTDAGRDVGPRPHVSLDYQEPAAESERTRAIVWLDRPIHRPGDVVDFAGLVRRCDGRRLADQTATPQRLLVRVDNADGKLWEGPCELSPAGTLHGRFRIPPAARMGPCWFHVDGVRAEPDLPLVVEEFRISTYQVGLSMARQVYTGGERIEGRVTVDYFTGKPAANADVEVVLETASPDAPTAAGAAGPDGVFRFSLSAPSLSRNETFVLRATATDVSGQSYTKCDYVTCRADAFEVRANPSEWQVAPGATVQIAVEAATWAGQPLAGATVVAGGVRQTATTDRQGKARLPWTVGADCKRADVTVIAGGKAVQQSFEVTLREESPSGHTAADDSRPPDRAKFELTSWQAPPRTDAGQPVDCTLTLKGPPDRRAMVAIFAESDRLLSSRVLCLPPGTHRLAIPTEREWAPSVTLVAVLLGGWHAQVETASCYLHPTEKFLTLEVQTDKAKYRPGERCTAIVTATDYRGRIVPGADISLGVVDEAIYQVRADPLPDLFRTLYEYRVADCCVGEFEEQGPPAEPLQFLLGPRYAWGYYWPTLLDWGSGRRSARLGCYGGYACGCSLGYGHRRPPVRRRFESTAHWVADLVTDAEGKARTTFDFPDNVAAWRFTARGVTADTRVGDLRVTRCTLLPLAVDLALPRGLRVGDQIDLPVVLHNNSDAARTVECTTRVGKAAERPWAKRLLPAHGDLRLTVPVTAGDREPLTVFASVRDSGGGDADAVRRTLVPLSRGRPVTRTWSGPLETAATIRVDMNARQGEKLQMVVCRQPGLAGVVAAALDELVQYPYGCVEQTMSRFMPAVVAGEAMKKAGLRSPAAQRLPEVVAQALSRLAEFQHADGGWGWWKDDESNDFMTAYVLEGLARCRRLDQPIDAKLLHKGSDYLLDRLKEQCLGGHRPESIGNVDLDVYAAHALALAYAQSPQEHKQGLDDLRAALLRRADEQSSPNLLDRILAAETWRLLGDRVAAAKDLQRFTVEAIPQRGNRGSIFAAAALLELGTALEPNRPHWPLLARQLAAARSGDDWGDTLTTSAAVRGLAAVLAAPPPAETPVTVSLDGRALGALAAASGNRIELRLSRVGTVELAAAKLPSEDFYQLRVEGLAAAPPAVPANAPVTLRTRLFQLQPLRREVAPDGAGRLPVACGVTHEVEIDAALRQPVSHARLTLPRPCGMELVHAPQRVDGVVAIEVRDDAVHFFIDHWDPGRHRIAFSVRAEVSGAVAAPPPELVPMYGDSLPTAVTGASAWDVRR